MKLTNSQIAVVEAIKANGGTDRGIEVHHGSACALKRKGVLEYVGDKNAGDWTPERTDWTVWKLAE